MVLTNSDGHTQNCHSNKYVSLLARQKTGKWLTHYHTMPHSEARKIYSCGKHCEKRRNCLQQEISHFLTMYSTP